ncbi:MAG: nucleotidyltransferase family protein [Candidatus Omnitrophica bacterium]|nr:nucleotidyltransferase family protein [Candidatus Omnitrophota bacterium]
MQAVILAGGKGTRLRPYTMYIPKPLLPVNEYPILDIILRQLKHYRVSEVVISTGHLAELIQAYCGRGKRWGLKIRYVKEEKALGTAGAIKNIKGLEDNFIVMNGDILTDLDYRHLFDFHLKNKAAMTLATIKRVEASDFGVLNFDKQFKLTGLVEKPKRYEYISIGINVLSKKCRKYIAKDESLGIPDLVSRMQKKEDIFCCETDAYWLDIGKVGDYKVAQEEFQKNKAKVFYD